MTDNEAKADGSEEQGGEVNLDHPSVQAAIEAARSAEREAALKSVEGLKQNRDQLLDEYKPWKGLKDYGSPDDIRKQLDTLQKLKDEQRAGELGVSSDDLRKEVESRVAQFKRESEESFLAAKEKYEGRITELESTLQKQVQQLNRSHIKAEVQEAGASIRENAMRFVVSELEKITVIESPSEGAPPVARIRLPGRESFEFSQEKAEERQPMTVAEVLRLAAKGRGPLPELGLFISSVASGSGTKTPGSINGHSTKMWHEYTPEQQSDLIAEHGSPEKSPFIAGLMQRSIEHRNAQRRKQAVANGQIGAN